MILNRPEKLKSFGDHVYFLVALNVMQRKWLLRLIWQHCYCLPRTRQESWSRWDN